MVTIYKYKIKLMRILFFLMLFLLPLSSALGVDSKAEQAIVIDFSTNEIVYYQIIVEDLFGKITRGNIVSNSLNKISAANEVLPGGTVVSIRTSASSLQFLPID